MPAREMSVNTGLSTVPSSGIRDPDTYAELLKVYNAVRNIVLGYDAVFGLTSPDPDTLSQIDFSRCNIGGFAKLYKQAEVAINYGQTVGLLNKGGGIATAVLGTSGTTIGMCTNTGGVLSGETCEILLIGISPAFSAGLLVPGNVYYQSATAGSIATGGTQALGRAISDTRLFLNPALL